MSAPIGSRPPLALDRLDECLVLGDRRLSLTPKAFAVLRYLMDHPARLVTKDELLSAVWPDAVVTERRRSRRASAKSGARSGTSPRRRPTSRRFIVGAIGTSAPLSRRLPTPARRIDRWSGVTET